MDDVCGSEEGLTAMLSKVSSGGVADRAVCVVRFMMVR